MRRQPPWKQYSKCVSILSHLAVARQKKRRGSRLSAFEREIIAAADKRNRRDRKRVPVRRLLAQHKALVRMVQKIGDAPVGKVNSVPLSVRVRAILALGGTVSDALEGSDV
jgi:hypothetical protein